MFDALKKSMIDAIEEGQLKLGYRDETIRLYYPLESLCALTGKRLSGGVYRGHWAAWLHDGRAAGSF